MVIKWNDWDEIYNSVTHANLYDNYIRRIMVGDCGFIKTENPITCPKTTAKEKANAMVKKVIFNPPATIVFFADGEKEVVKCQNGEPFDEEKGLAMALIKHWVKLPVFNKMLEGAERKGLLKDEESDNSKCVHELQDTHYDTEEYYNCMGRRYYD